MTKAPREDLFEKLATAFKKKGGASFSAYVRTDDVADDMCIVVHYPRPSSLHLIEISPHRPPFTLAVRRSENVGDLPIYSIQHNVSGWMLVTSWAEVCNSLLEEGTKPVGLIELLFQVNTTDLTERYLLVPR